jgi:hypothetical protein
MWLMAEAMLEPNTQDPTARDSPPVPIMVTAGEGEATPPASPVLRTGKWNSNRDWNVYLLLLLLLLLFDCGGTR